MNHEAIMAALEKIIEGDERLKAIGIQRSNKKLTSENQKQEK